MKKIFAILLVLFLASGCDGDTEMLSCSSTTTQNGIITTTSYDVEYNEDEVKHITITYDYSTTADEDDVDGVRSDTDGLTEDNNSNGMDNNGNNARNNNGNNNDATNNDVNNNTDNDSVNTNNTANNGGNNNTNNNNGTTNNNQRTRTEDIVDGVVGDAIDSTVDGVRETILDIAGIRNNYENQLSTYDGIEGFSYKVDVDSNTEYKIIYDIDMDKISDADLAQFNVVRDFSGMKDNYEDLGYTCR